MFFFTQAGVKPRASFAQLALVLGQQRAGSDHPQVIRAAVGQGLAEPGIPGFGLLHERLERESTDMVTPGCGLGA